MSLKTVVSLPTLLLVVLLGAPGCSKSKSSSVTSPAAELNSGTITPGTAYQHQFLGEGSFSYHCSFHSVMHGSVLVSASSAVTDSNVVISEYSFTPSSIVVRPGATVRWTNNGALSHTVTSD